MVVDTSALIAILNGEPERHDFLNAIDAADQCFISALNLYEAQLVALARFGGQGLQALAQLVDRLGFSIVAFHRRQAELSAAAYERYGKGVGNPATLNLCDCAAYAFAQQLNMPLLFKGGDFASTDVTGAV